MDLYTYSIMDSITYNKYKLLKTNNNIWKRIWNIKNNKIRNKYINSILIHYIHKEPIDLYYKDNLSIGMPNKKYEIYYDIFFNIYSLNFDIILYYTINNIKQYSNYTYQNGEPEDIYLYLMKNVLIKNSHLLNSLLKKLRCYKMVWYNCLQKIIKQITYINKLYDMDHHILIYLMELK